MSDSLRYKTLLWVVVAALLVYVAQFLITGYRYRRSRRQLPGPPHSWIFGDLKNVRDVAAQLPDRVHPHTYPHGLRKEYGLGSFFYLDLWPMSDPIIAVLDPAISQQFTVKYNALKPKSLPDFLEPLAGKDDMVSANGAIWKKWRSIFNPGFSTQHLMTLVPGIVDDALVYVEKLVEHAEINDLFRLEEDTTCLTIDVIGKVVLDMRFNTQRGNNECVNALRDQVQYLPNETFNPFLRWRPYSIYRRWKNDRIMKRYIGKILDDRFARNKRAPTINRKERKHTIIDLALDSYSASNQGKATDDESLAEHPIMDAEFREGAITQIRIFLFAGHDTTSSTICYAFHLLRRNPSVLQRLRCEHERVLGPISQTAEKIKSDPNILHKLEYTLCVIKETLRLYPPASASKAGEKGLFLTDPRTGERYPTEGYMIWIVQYGLGRYEEVWGSDAAEFRPERFLSENSHRIPEGAFRAFELGYRNCIGQNLALIESKIILAMTCRMFEFDVCLDSDSLHMLRADKGYYAGDSSFRGGKQSVEGEDLYQVLVGAAKPREGMPCRVRKLEWSMED